MASGPRRFVGGIEIRSDASRTYFGAGNDASIYYDGTDMVFDSQEVGSGDYQFNNGEIKANGGIAAGAYLFAEDAGFVTAMDLPVSATPAAGTQESYTFKIDGVSFLKVYAEADSAGGIQNPSLRFFKPRVLIPSSDLVLDTTDDITVTNPIMRVVGDAAAKTLTSTPTLVAAADGMHVIIQGTSDANTVTLQDESNLAGSKLQLAGGADMVLAAGDTLVLIYDAGDANWYEISRSNN